MFSEAITKTPLTNQDADIYFKGIIDGGTYCNDKTFLATLRALVTPRLKEGESLKLIFDSATLDWNLQNFSDKDAVRLISDGLRFAYAQEKNVLQVENLRNYSEDNTKTFKALENEFENYNRGWKRLEKVTELYKESFYVDCFVNENDRNVVLFIDRLDIRKMHYLQCGVLGFFPWYFDPKDGVTKDEMDLMKSLMLKDSSTYMKCLGKIALQYNLKEIKIKRLLSGIENRRHKVEMQTLRDKIVSLQSHIQKLNEYIGDDLKELSDNQIRLLGLETRVENNPEDSEIMNYFLVNNSVSLESADDDKIIFVCKGYVDYFDEDLAKEVINSKRSYIYRPEGEDYSKYINTEDMRKLMTAIFIDQELRVKFCAAYGFYLGGNIYAIGGYDYGNEFSEYMPNPHINVYECLGNYQRVINELLMKDDYIGAIEQCIASCKSLNFGDSVVMTHFMKTIYGRHTTNNCCIELPNGETVTPKAAIKWLKENEEE